MAFLIHKGRRIDVPEGCSLIRQAEEVGVIFGCKEGICEICKVTVLAGEENLNEPTPNETGMGVQKPYRLLCQCTIKKGAVVIHQEPLGGFYDNI